MSVQHHKELLHITTFKEKESTMNALLSRFLPLFFSLDCEYLVGLTEGFVWSSRSLSAPNSSAEGMAQNLPLFIYLLTKRSICRKLCFDPGFKKSHLSFTPRGLLKALVMRSTSHHELTARCI